jgi:hypothetical protein
MATRLYPEDPDPPPRQTGDWSIEPEDRPFYAEEPPGGIGRFLRPFIYGLFAVACAGTLWFAYDRGRHGATPDGTVPLIRADQGATKIRPADPGGAAVPDQDNPVYNLSQRNSKPEQMLAPPEKPLAKPLPPPPDAAAPLPVQQVGPTPEPKAAPPTPASAILPPATSSGTLSLPAGSRPAAAAPPVPIAVHVPAPAVEKPPAKPAEPVVSGSVRIQVAATRDEASARSEWERLKKAHPDLLDGLTPNIVKADLGDKGIYYRVQAGPVKDREKADKLCGELKKFAVACILAQK